MAKFCKKCGSPLKEGVKFCTSCGAPINPTANGSGTQSVGQTPPTVQAVQPQPTIHQPPVTPQATTFSSATMPAKKPLNKALIGGIIAALVIVLGGGGGY